MSDVLGAIFTIALSVGMIALLWRYGLDGLWQILRDAMLALTGATEALVHRLAHGPAGGRPMGLRPNQPARPPRRPLPARCAHDGAPVPVEVHDTRDGHPETVAWLCPDCTEEVPGPGYDRFGRRLPSPPPGRGGGSPVGGKAEAIAWIKAHPGEWQRLKDEVKRQFETNDARPSGMLLTGGIYATTIRTRPDRAVCAREGHEVTTVRAWGGTRVREVCARCDEPHQPDPLIVEPPTYDYVGGKPRKPRRTGRGVGDEGDGYVLS